MKPMTTLRLFSITAIASASCFFASCGEKKGGETAPEAPEAPEAAAEKQDTPDSLTDELLDQLNVYADTLLAIKDKAGAEEAAKQLTIIGDDIEAIALRLDKLDTPSEEEQKRLNEKMNAASKAVGEKVGNSVNETMSDQEVAQTLMPALMEFGQRMNKYNAIFERFGMKEKAPAKAPPAKAPPAAPAPAAPAPAPPAPAPPAAQ